MAGVAIADGVGSLGPTASITALGGSLACATAAALQRRRVQLAATGLATLAAALAGFWRYQLTLERGEHHVFFLRQDEPISIDAYASVETSPVDSWTPAEQKNTRKRGSRANFLARLSGQTKNGQIHPLEGLVSVSLRLPKAFHAVDLKFGPGDLIRIEGMLLPARQVRNPGEVDWERIQWLKGIDARITCDDVDRVSQLPRPAFSVLHLRESFRALARRILLESDSLHDAPDSSRLIDAMILGQRSSTARHIDEAFVKAGAIHFLSVSGFHVAVLVGMAYGIAKLLTRDSRYMTGLLTLAFLAAYVFLAELNAPMIRTAIGVLLLVIGGWIGRPTSPLNWLATAAILILLLDPRELLRPGFQLSFLQVAFLIVAFSPVQAWVQSRTIDTGNVGWLFLRRILVASALGIGVSLGAWLISMPVVLWHFERFTPWGALGAVLATPLITLLLWASFAAILANTFLVFLSPLVLPSMRWLSQQTLNMVEFIASWPAASIDVSAPPLWLVLASYAGCVLLVWVYGRQSRQVGDSSGLSLRRRGMRYWCFGIAAALAGVWTAHGFSRLLETGSVILHVMDVSAGSLSLLSSSGRGCLIDAGGAAGRAADVLLRAQRDAGVKGVALLVITRADVEAISNLQAVCDAFRDFTVAAPPALTDMRQNSVVSRSYESQLMLGATDSSSRPSLVHAGDRIPWGDQQLQVLWPPADRFELASQDRNLVLRQEVTGGAVLICGTVRDRALLSLVNLHKAGELNLKSTVLLVTDTDAPTASSWSAFLQVVRPRWVCVTGRPRSADAQGDALYRETATACGASYFSTHRDGAITVQCDRHGEWRASAMVEHPP